MGHGQRHPAPNTGLHAGRMGRPADLGVSGQTPVDATKICAMLPSWTTDFGGRGSDEAAAAGRTQQIETLGGRETHGDESCDGDRSE